MNAFVVKVSNVWNIDEILANMTPEVDFVYLDTMIEIVSFLSLSV